MGASRSPLQEEKLPMPCSSLFRQGQLYQVPGDQSSSVHDSIPCVHLLHMYFFQSCTRSAHFLQNSSWLGAPSRHLHRLQIFNAQFGMRWETALLTDMWLVGSTRDCQSLCAKTSGMQAGELWPSPCRHPQSRQITWAEDIMGRMSVPVSYPGWTWEGSLGARAQPMAVLSVCTWLHSCSCSFL